MIITIDDAENTVYYINCNPLTNTYHVGSVAPNVHMSSGQPISVRSIVSSEVMDMIYEVYTDVLEGMDDEGDVPYPTNWSVGYDRAGATEVEDLLNSHDFLTVNAIKHPDRDEWAIPFQDTIFSFIPDSDIKTQLLTFATASVVNGNRKTHDEMIAGGWVNG
jgi:hypothetical protein